MNIFYLIVGILSILFSFTHGLNGQTGILHSIGASGIDTISKTAIFYVWHIITAENMVFGIAFLIMAFKKDKSKTDFAAWMIAVIIIARWCVILGSTLLMNAKGLAGTLIDSIAIIVFVGLIIAGTRKRAKNNTNT